MNSNPTQANARFRCTACGGVLDASRVEGLCPACMWRAVAAPPDEPAAPAELDGRPLPPRSWLNIPGLVIGPEIARGGMGIVYRARQQQPEREVALKMLLPHQLGSADMRARFQLEIRAIAGLDHPAILPVYQVGEHEGLPFFTMKLATGGTLAARRERYRGRFREIAELMVTLVEAVQFAHERGVIHRDLKPGNILFDAAGRVYVSDFGLAKFVASEPAGATGLTGSIHLLGTPQFLAPEVAAGGVRCATIAGDVYSLGAVLYELLAGAPPFAGETLPALLRIVRERLPMRPSKRTTVAIPRDLEVICLKCLAKEPVARYASASALAEDLRRWLDGRPILARPSRAAEYVWSWARRNPVVAGLSVLLAVTFAGGTALQIRANHDLRRALAASREAQAAAQENLRQALIAEAGAQRRTGEIGQRFGALASVARAAAIQTTLDGRNEAAAALALRDLRVDDMPLPVFFADADSTTDFSDDLSEFATSIQSGGFAVRSAGGAVVRCTPDHRMPADHLRFSPDGRAIFAGYATGAAEVWSLPEMRLRWRRAGGQTQGMSVGFDVGSNAIVFADAAGAVIRHELASGRERVVARPERRVLGLACSPAGDAVAVVLGLGVEVWDLRTGNLRWRLDGRFSTPEAAWTRDGTRVAVGDSLRNVIFICDSRSGAERSRLHTPGLKPERLAFDPTGAILASVGPDRMLRLWDVQSGSEQLRRGAAPRVLRFSADARQLAFAPRHLVVARAELAPMNVWREWRGEPGHGNIASGLAVSPDGQWVTTSAAGHIRLWHARTGRQIDSVVASVEGWSSVFFDSAGRQVIYCDLGRGVFQRELQPDPEAGGGMRFSREERRIASDGLVTSLGTGGREWLIHRRVTNEVALWPGGRPQDERVLLSGTRIQGVHLSPDGRWLATQDAPYPSVTLREIATNKSSRLEMPSHADVEFSPNGRWLFTGTAEQYVAWETGTWRERARWPATLDGRGRGSIWFSPDGRFVALRQERERLQILDTKQLREIVTLETPRPIDLVEVAWSPDAERLFLLGASHGVYEWNLAELARELTELGLGWTP